MHHPRQNEQLNRCDYFHDPVLYLCPGCLWSYFWNRSLRLSEVAGCDHRIDCGRRECGLRVDAISVFHIVLVSHGRGTCVHGDYDCLLHLASNIDMVPPVGQYVLSTLQERLRRRLLCLRMDGSRARARAAFAKFEIRHQLSQ